MSKMKKYLTLITVITFFVSGIISAQPSKWAIKGDIKDTSDNRHGKNWVTPQMFGAIADGVTDASSEIKKTLNQSISGEAFLCEKILFTGEYLIKSNISVNCNHKELKLIFTQNGKIISDSSSTNYNWYIPYGRFTIKNCKKLIIDGMTLESTNNSSLAIQDNGLLIDDCDEVELINVKVKSSAYGGIQIRNVRKLTMINCEATNNLYAGFIGVGVKNVNVSGGNFSYNGVPNLFSMYGYGITFAQPWGTGLDNENIIVKGVSALYNFRKGIDAHDAVNIAITNNKVIGFGYCGIYAVSESGNDGAAFVKNVTIDDNVVLNDKAWYDAYFIKGSQSYGIVVGCYDSTQSGGAFTVSNNILDLDMIESVRAGILSMINKKGKPIDEIRIQNNDIENLKNNYASPNVGYAGILVLGDNDTAVVPKAVMINNNMISGEMPFGVYVIAGNDIAINKNILNGAFRANTIDGLCESCTLRLKNPTVYFKRTGNIYNNLPLPDVNKTITK